MAAGGMVVSFVAVMLLTRERRVPGVARAVPVAVVATALGGGAIFGLFFVALHHTHANVLYLLAIRHGMLTVVAAVAGLYPASTVLLAHTHLGERLRPMQVGGLAVATMAAVLLVTA